jgi:hypothetical protein
MHTDPVRLPPVGHALRQTDSPLTLTACSLCLRVLRGSEWLEPEHVISEIRSYELAAPPRLEPAVCDICADSILSRRDRVNEALAA